MQFADVDPLGDELMPAFGMARDRVGQQHADDKGRAGGRRCDPADGLFAPGLFHEPAAEDEVGQQPDEGEEHDPRSEMKEAGCFHALSLEAVHIVHVDAAFGLEDLHDQRQADRHLRRRHRDDEEDEDLSAETLDDAAERHHRQVCGVEHQLDGHEDDQRVAARQHAGRANGKEDG